MQIERSRKGMDEMKRYWREQHREMEGSCLEQGEEIKMEM